MENSDILRLITSRVDNSVIHLLSQVKPIWSEIVQFADDQYWWYLRCQYLLGRELMQRPGGLWKSAYYSLEASLSSDSLGFDNYTLPDPLAVKILIEIGLDPARYNDIPLTWSCDLGYTARWKDEPVCR